MSTRRKDTMIKTSEMKNAPELEICSCPPLSTLCLQSAREQEGQEEYQLLPVSPTLNTLIRTRMQELLTSTLSVSILLLHVSQLEGIYITPENEVVHKRKRFHPSATIVEQVLTNVRRAVRVEDNVYSDMGKGAAILFPHVDRQGACMILERVYHSVNLLQSETLVPPLTLETNIMLSIASYPEQGQSLEDVFACAGRVVQHMTLRPAITQHLWDTMPSAEHPLPFLDAFDLEGRDNENTQSMALVHSLAGQDAHSVTRDTTPFPFLQLPPSLSKRMKNLLPYKTATQFSCVPVGRDHNRLTLAMANPMDAAAISAIHEHTGMSIFPVSCDKDALAALLAERW